MSRQTVSKKKKNNRGRGWDIIPDPSWGDGGSFVRIFETDEMGREAKTLAEFYIKPEETVEDAVKDCVEQATHPFSSWEADYDANTKEALFWLADALDIPTK